MLAQFVYEGAFACAPWFLPRCTLLANKVIVPLQLLVKSECIHAVWCFRGQPAIPRTWIGKGESMSERKGWGSSGGRLHEPCLPAPLLEQQLTASATSLSPWPPLPPPASSSLVSRGRSPCGLLLLSRYESQVRHMPASQPCS